METILKDMYGREAFAHLLLDRESFRTFHLDTYRGGLNRGERCQETYDLARIESEYGMVEAQVIRKNLDSNSGWYKEVLVWTIDWVLEVKPAWADGYVQLVSTPRHPPMAETDWSRGPTSGSWTRHTDA